MSIKPLKKAPNIPSSPISSLSAALRNMIAKTKINCITESLYILRNQRVSLGIMKRSITQYTTNFTRKRSQNTTPGLSPPCTAPVVAATSIKVMSSDNIDAPTESVVTLCFCSPYLATIG